jgi:hypothetical protein
MSDDKPLLDVEALDRVPVVPHGPDDVPWRCNKCTYTVMAPKDVAPPCENCGTHADWTSGRQLVRRAVEQMTRKERKRAFLDELAMTGNVTEACENLGLAHGLVYKWRDKAPAFREAWERALAIGVDRLNMEARRRAVQGVLEPVGFFKGKPSAYVRKYSDALLIQLLKANDPKHNPAQNVQITGILARIDVSKCTEDQLNRLIARESPLSIFGGAIPEELLLPEPTGRNLDALPAGSE